MTFREAVFYGILQGLTEFLPVSSSGHLALLHTFFGREDAGTDICFDILLHLATLIVVLVVYRKDIFALFPAAFSVFGKILRGHFRFLFCTEAERMVILLTVATVPLIGALFLEDAIGLLALYPRVIGLLLILNGCLLLAADAFAAKGKTLSPKGAFGIGFFQLLAIVPGISRSGSTIAGGMLFGLSRKEAVKFSFLMSVPAILGANILNIPDAIAAFPRGDALIYTLAGMAAATVSGFLAVKLLHYIAKKEKFGSFAYYCIIIGILSVLWL
jgi:undecaprenyl-diphosphatase